MPYDINLIIELSKTLSSHKLNLNIENYLNNILLDIKKPVYNITPNFNSNSYNKNSKNKNTKYYKNSKKTYTKEYNTKETNNKNYYVNNNTNDKINNNNNITNDNSNNIINENSNTNYKINRLKDINNKSEYNIIITNIRKILNKITDITYDKLKTEFLCYYKSIYNDKKNIETANINSINLFIFESLVYNNMIFNNIYSDMLSELININSEFLNILNNHLDIFKNIYNYIKVPLCNSGINEENEINKNNDKFKCLCRFYIFCYKINLIQINAINNCINNLQEELLNNIKVENKTSYNELLTQFIFLIISNVKLSDENIINNFKFIANSKNKSYLSISNKIIFKHKDIVDKYI